VKFMFFSKRKDVTEEIPSGWKIKDQALIDYDRDAKYPVDNLVGSFDESTLSVTFWHQGKYLITLPCKEALFVTLTKLGLAKCDISIVGDVEFEALDEKQRHWYLHENSALCCAEKSYSLAGLRFELNAEQHIVVKCYGVTIMQLISDQIDALEQAKSSYLDRKYQRLDGSFGLHTSKKSSNVGCINSEQVILTTESSFPFSNIARLGIVAAECLCEIAIDNGNLKIANGGSGKQAAQQNSFKQAKNTVLTKLKSDANELGATAVVGVNLDYQLLSGDCNLLLLAATGTAIKIVATEAPHSIPASEQKLAINIANVSLFENPE
jgi:uncharacterized protein YbjQ (UPF0145 family)